MRQAFFNMAAGLVAALVFVGLFRLLGGSQIDVDIKVAFGFAVAVFLTLGAVLSRIARNADRRTVRVRSTR